MLMLVASELYSFFFFSFDLLGQTKVCKLGASLEGEKITAELMEHRLALISGTSSCHMCVSREPLYIKGIWGPYFSSMIPDLWLTEGGQSATGLLSLRQEVVSLLSVLN